MKKIFFISLFIIFSTSASWAEVKSKIVNYKHGGTSMKGYLVWDDSFQGKRPGVLVVHEWWGLNDYARGRAEQLAKLGYVAFAADMYGGGRSTTHPEEAKKMATEARENQKVWMGRAKAALKVLKHEKLVDRERLAAIGYCFGGATVLQMAYTGADLDAVVSFHGALSVPESTKKIKARLLILHGADDSFIKPDTIQELKRTLEQGNVPFKFVAYPNAVHGFTVPGSGKAGIKGVAYNARADRESWKEMKQLFHEVFE